MQEQEKQSYLERYRQAKEKGIPFFPDALFKDAVVSLGVFAILVALAFFVGAQLEARADPADTSYTPRPEWYFLFLFQLLKYFPGALEVVGVVVLPTLAVLVLFALPFIDRSAKRHYLNRPVVIGATAAVMVAIVALSALAVIEAPPPSDVTQGDPTAALYARNCAGCHGPSIDVPAGTNLHEIIAQGKHEGMPAWSADLTTDQIDSLAGFILSPAGSTLFTRYCAECHETSELVATDPIELKASLEQGANYPPHVEANVPEWTEVMTQAERTSLLNFLVAPDGQRLFSINCAPCHGSAVAFSGEESELENIIRQGGLHLEMPPWQERLDESELETLSRYVVNPTYNPEGEPLFQQYCTSCHGERVPDADNFEQAVEVISVGGPHETMPVWGEILTAEQIAALVSYTQEAAQGAPIELGSRLYAQNCASCHGDFGEGGPNPARPGDVIAPISTSEYLQTRDDITLRRVISQGQPNFGMSPFAASYGGPLDDEEIDALLAFIRSWEDNPPVELPPEVEVSTVSLSGSEIYADLCAQCHGPDANGGIAPSLRDPVFRDNNTPEDIFSTINQGHMATAMIAWGEVLTGDQIQQLVDFILALPKESPERASGAPSFAARVLPILEARCQFCHGTDGGWDASTYETVMETGDHTPVVIPGDAENSLLAQKLLGTQTIGDIMPPRGTMPQEEIQVILDWIEAGAPNN